MSVRNSSVFSWAFSEWSGCLPVMHCVSVCAYAANPKSRRRSISFAEARGNQRFQRVDGLDSFAAGRSYRDRSSGRRSEHHQAHDRCSADGLVPAGDANLGVEFFHCLHEFGGGARVQAFLVADDKGAHHRLCGSRLRLGHAGTVLARGVHLPDKTRLAMVTYLRPASCAAATASASGHSSRTLASFTSIGRLIPASTSTLGRLITEIARFDGVPPNMSVKIATPSPLSTRRTASMMSLRRASTSSSGPMVIASIWACGPTTCSNAARNSIASRPWVTSTRPIMELPAGASPLRRTKGCTS